MLVTLPYYAFFSVWVGSGFNVYRGAEVAKDILILVLLGVTVLATPWSGLLAYLKQYKLLVGLIGTYIALTIIYGVYAFIMGGVTFEALGFSLVSNLQFMTFFIAVHLLFSCHDLRLPWVKVVILPAVPVIIFGLLQQFVLPPRFLEHFGYSMFTILPFQYVDNDPSLLRVQSFLRGANPLGAYLTVILLTLAYQVRISKHARQRVVLAGLLVLGTLVMFYTYSRSAWIGSVVACLLLWLIVRRSRGFARHGLMLLAGIVTVVTVLAFEAGIAHHPVFQRAILHSDVSSLTEDTSNGIRASRIKESIREVRGDVWGDGPGTAGPASVHNAPHPVFITENYYLQIALEVGIVGLVIFLGVVGLIAGELWKRRESGLSVVLFTSLVGVSIINMASHAWTDDTLGLLWWGLAGVAVSSYRKRIRLSQ
jgi:hypothetical protein